MRKRKEKEKRKRKNTTKNAKKKLRVSGLMNQNAKENRYVWVLQTYK